MRLVCIFNLDSTVHRILLRFVKDLRISAVVRFNKHRYWINIFHVCGVILTRKALETPFASRALSNGSVWSTSIHDLQMAFLNSGVKKKCHIVTVYKKQIYNEKKPDDRLVA